MLIVFDSCTGNVARFVSSLQATAISIEETRHKPVCEPFVFVTYTTGFGQVPDSSKTWLEHNSTFIRGVAASGNRNWGQAFARSATHISEQYNIPVLHTFEMFGTKKDV
ncbi:MAG: class Ib ribonucleoside-diphosphate reductase assembly flavoprotein NrdI, partial [Bacilli bacterium]